MQTYPLIRTKLSNQRIMSALVLVLVFYNLQRFISDPVEILWAFLLVSTALVFDAFVNFFRYRRMVCAVSAAVTALVLYTISPGIPLWGSFAALGIALVVGKHIWGGTGKNPVNPAMVGLLFVGLYFSPEFNLFFPSLLLIPALLFSLPFLLSRPLPGIGMMVGMLAALLTSGDFIGESFFRYGIIFWGCIVITDPVTTTAKPILGGFVGLLAGFVPLMVSHSIAAVSIGILLSNVLSFGIDRYVVGFDRKFKLRFNREQIPFDSENTIFINLAGETQREGTVPDLTYKEIIQRIEQNHVYGFGGAAFPTHQKIKTAANACASSRHLIINGAECDPGLIHDKWLLYHRADDIMKGILILNRCALFTTVTIAAKDLSSLCFSQPVRLRQVPDYYPAGAEHLLIKEILGREIPKNVIPTSVGVLVLNVQTVLAIYEAVSFNQKADTKYFTYANLFKKTGTVVKAPLGADVNKISRKFNPRMKSVFTGGGMLNAKLCSGTAKLEKTVNFIAVAKYPTYRESLCSQCGLCSAVCPAHLNVSGISRLIEQGKMEPAIKLHPERCLNCGSCSYVCLAGRNLAARMRDIKSFITS